VQGLVGAALAVPREVVQPAFAALGKRHLSILKQHAALQHLPALVAAVTGCIGEATTWIIQAAWNSSPCKTACHAAAAASMYGCRLQQMLG